ncbi:MAG: barstar family protein [Elusimicrobiota bacterium]
MKKLVMFVAIVLVMLAGSAYAQQGGGLAALRSAAAGITPALPAVPAAQPAAGDISDGLLKAAVPADLADLNAGQAAALALAARAAGIAVFELDGVQMKTKPELMAHAAQALGFPGDFGRNWDALIDYLGEMPDFQHNDRVLILVHNSAAILTADAVLYAGLRDAAGLACENAREWSRSTAVLKFVFIP